MADRTCSIEGCERKHSARGLCGLHYSRARSEGNAVSYRCVHDRLTTQRGPAKQHACAECGKPARQWAYDNADPNELVSRTGAYYSADLSHYRPQCQRCHRDFDNLRRTSDLQAMAKAVQADIRHAVAKRDKARRIGRPDLESFWDDELERLIAPLQSRVGPLT